jgi:hypothetical protein
MKQSFKSLHQPLHFSLDHIFVGYIKERILLHPDFMFKLKVTAHTEIPHLLQFCQLWISIISSFLLYPIFPTVVLGFMHRQFLISEHTEKKMSSFHTMGSTFARGRTVLASKPSFQLPDYYCGVSLSDTNVCFMLLCITLCLEKEQATWLSFNMRYHDDNFPNP